MSEYRGRDLPKAQPGGFDSVLGVDESTGELRRFPTAAVSPQLGYLTRADLFADLAHPAGTVRRVTNDATVAYNGDYIKEGDVGAGSWTKAADRLSDIEGDVSELQDYTGLLDDHVLEYVPAKNLYNPADKVAGTYVASDGSIASSASWGRTAFIPVEEGQSYTISANSTRRAGSAFYSSASGASYISGSYSGSTASPQTRIAPAGANYLVVNLYSNTITEPTEFQIEEGGIATEYEAWHVPYPKLRRDAIEPPIEDATTPEYVETRDSRNLYDPTAKASGNYVASNGSIGSAANWAHSGFIEIPDGATHITINANAAKRHGLAFYTAASGAAYISGTYDATTTLPLTVEVPVGATHIAVNVASNTVSEPSEIMIEVGDEATTYESFGEKQEVTKSKVTPEIDELSAQMMAARLVMSSSSAAGSSFLDVPLGASTLRIRFSPFLPAGHSASTVWNFHSFLLDGEDQSQNATDDVAPYRIMDWTVGANHGYPLTKLTAAGHGKALVDVGSVWSDGVDEWVIVNVPSVNRVDITKRAGLGTFAGGTLTHVSGATNTADITPSDKAADSWFPAINNRRFAISVDGVPITDYDETYYPQRCVTFAESYDILDKDSIVEWLITQAGTATDITAYEGTAAATVSTAYVFDTFGGVTIYTDFLALEAANFQDIMFTQAYPLAETGGTLNYLVPDTASLAHESVSYDFSKVEDMTSWAPATRLDFTSGTIADPAVWPDRVVMWNESLGMAVGYLPERDAAPAVRPMLASRKALQISTNGKVYPSAIDSASRTTMAAGDYFSVVAYRTFFLPPTERTASYVVRGATADYLYCDWHASTRDRVPLPPDLHGRAFTEERVSSGVAVLSGFATDSIVFDVTTSGGAGQYAVLKFER